MRHPIYFGTVLLEPNRWTSGKTPTVHVGDWLARMAEAGFDGIELWENHCAWYGPDDCRTAPLPVTIFNSYASCEKEGEADRRRAAASAAAMGARRIKFNVGAEDGLKKIYLAQAGSWLGLLPEDTVLLCECHPGTVMETPDVAAEYFAAWDNARFQAIIHPFGKPDGEVRRWFQRLGPHRITHVHVQLRDAASRMMRLEHQADSVVETVRILKDEGFAGSFTIEFTEGVAIPPEDPDRLWRNAVADLGFLRKVLEGMADG